MGIRSGTNGKSNYQCICGWADSVDLVYLGRNILDSGLVFSRGWYRLIFQKTPSFYPDDLANSLYCFCNLFWFFVIQGTWIPFVPADFAIITTASVVVAFETYQYQ